MQASGSAPEAQTLHQLSQAKQAETVEVRRMKRDLQTLHSDPSTLPKPPAAPTPANAVAAPQAAAQPAQQHHADMFPLGAGAQQAAAAAQLQVFSDQAVTAAMESSTAAGIAAAPRLTDGVTKTAQASAGDTTEIPDLAVAEGGANAADGDFTLGHARDATATNAPEATQASEAKQDVSMGTDQIGTSAVQPQADDVRPVATESAAGQEADTAGPAAQPRADGQKAKKQGTAAATGKPKGKRNPPPVQKGVAKRQKLKQTDRSYSEEAEAAMAPANQTARAYHADDDDDDDDEAAISSDEETMPAAVNSLAKTQSSKTKKALKGKAAAGKKRAGKASAITAHGKKHAAGTDGKAHAKAFGKKAAVKRGSTDASAVAADHNDVEDEDSMLLDDTDDKAQSITEAQDEAAAKVADQAEAPSAAATRERRAKPKEILETFAKQSPQKAKKPAKQQKLPFHKAAASSPKQSKATAAAAAATSAASDGAAETAAAPVAKAAKAKAGSEKKSAVSAEPVSSGKEAKGKQSKASPKSLQTQAKTHAKTAKQQKQRIAVGELKCI